MESSSPDQDTRTNRWIRVIRNHPLVSIAALLVTVLLTVGQLTDTVTRIWRTIRPPAAIGQLTLESVRLSRGDSVAAQFGNWQLIALADSEYRNPPERRESVSRSIPGGSRTCVSVADGRPHTLDWLLHPGSENIPQSEETEEENGEEGDTEERTAAPVQPNALGVTVYFAEWQFSPTPPVSWKRFTSQALAGLDSAGDRAQERPGGPPRPEGPRQASEMTCEDLIRVLGNEGHIVQGPVFQLLVRNTGKAPVTVLDFAATPLRNHGGEAGAGGAPVEPVGDMTEIALSWDSAGTAAVNPAINLDPGITTLLEIRPRVVNAAQGDGPGWLLFHLSLGFHDGKKIVKLPIGNFLLADDIGALATY